MHGQISQEKCSNPETPSTNSAACQMGGKEWLKGILPMVICCAVPLLLLGAVVLFGISLGAAATGFLNIAAVVACPVAMFLMMRMMMKNK